MHKNQMEKFPSPHSGILFLCMWDPMDVDDRDSGCFRPLIRGFFFYLSKSVINRREKKRFPSPHSGILFLSAARERSYQVQVVSVPSFGDSFFI